MYHRLSQIFWPRSVIPKDSINIKAQTILSNSQKLMHEMGLIKPIGNGTYQITPILQRSIDKCINLIISHMNKINGQKVTLSFLTPPNLWEKTGRLSSSTVELFLIKEHDKPVHLLSPTHEESITSLLAQSHPISYKQLPIKLYQIGAKFRNELKPRFGLIRAKEFIMKDLYSFDQNLIEAEKTYHEINEQYESFFESLQIPWVKIEADSGMMGGKLSHEYQIVSNIGEDIILKCSDCNFVANKEIYNEENLCPKCESTNIIESKGIEIGHTFLLNDKYSKPLGATFLNPKGKTENFIMGCYGIGVSRLIASCIEVLSTDSEIKWPILLAPFDVCVIPPKHDSIEDKAMKNIINDILEEIVKSNEIDSVLVDDRTNLTIGKRLMDAKKMGYSNIIVLGNKCLQDPPKFEFFKSLDGNSEVLTFDEVLKTIENFRLKKESLKNMI